jgi:hypothetical protein
MRSNFASPNSVASRLRSLSLRTLETVQCADEVMLGRVLDLNDGFLLRAANMTEDAVRMRFDRCPTAFRCLVTRGEAGADCLAGYFILLPLNEGCCEALGAGMIKTGRDIQPLDLAAAGERIAGVYLSVVCAIGHAAQAAAIFGVIEALRDLYSSKDVRVLYARAATKAGAHMLARLSGTEFEADGRIHAIEMSQYPLITSPR